MSLPRRDILFLRTVYQKLSSSYLSTYRPHKNRASTAIVLRFGGRDASFVSQLIHHYRPETINDRYNFGDILDVLERHSTDEAASSLRVLFMKRADREADRWSGHVAFPGGKRDAVDDDDQATAEREMFEEIGIPLRSIDFVPVGRLPDMELRSRTFFTVQMVLSQYVYLHVGDLTPSVKINLHEVDGVQWVPLEMLKKSNVNRQIRSFPVNTALRQHTELRELVQHLGTTRVHYPAIQLVEGNWPLWGITLTSTSKLLAAGGRERIDWPVVSVNGWFVQTFVIDAAHGYFELVHKSNPPNIRHVGALFLTIFSVCSVVVLLMPIVHEMMVGISLIFRSHEKHEAVMKKYAVPGEEEYEERDVKQDQERAAAIQTTPWAEQPHESDEPAKAAI